MPRVGHYHAELFPAYTVLRFSVSLGAAKLGSGSRLAPSLL